MQCLLYSITIYFLKNYALLPVLGLRCCSWGFSSCREQGLLFVAVCGLLLLPSQALECSAAPWHVASPRTRDRTWVPFIGSGFLSTEPPGKSQNCLLKRPPYLGQGPGPSGVLSTEHLKLSGHRHRAFWKFPLTLTGSPSGCTLSLETATVIPQNEVWPPHSV